MLTYLEIARDHRPRWIVWENVPGVLSSNGGRDFGTFLGALGELGYGWAYRILDAQWFGVAQRRRRVFVVGCLGDQRAASKILFESESVRRDTPQSREKRQEASGTIKGGSGSRDYPDPSDGNGGGLVCIAHGQANAEIRTDGGAPALTCNHEAPIICHGTQDPCVLDKAFALGRNSGQENVVLTRESGQGYWMQDDKSGCLRAEGENRPSRPSRVIVQHMQVRRLTPVECERLQGFIDGYTNVPWRNKPEAPDGLRYKALGNSMAVPVMRWIGERINQYEHADPQS